MRYVQSKIKQEMIDETYRIYVTEGLKIITENTGRSVMGGQYMTAKYYDIIYPKPEETRTGDEIIDELRNKLKLLE